MTARQRNPTFAPSGNGEASLVENWRVTLEAGDTAAAWDHFIERYRRLIYAAVRRTVSNPDDVEEVFAEVCGELSSDDMARLAQHNESGSARFSTWLVTVVQRLAIDWVRHRDGRRRVNAPEGMSELQQFIFDRIVREKCTYVEAYELALQQIESGIPFGEFMKEVNTTLKRLAGGSGMGIGHYFPGPPESMEQEQRLVHDSVALADTAARVAAALRTLPPDERLAVQLFVVDELPAATVAKLVGWPNAKAVYNRVYRALGVLKRHLAGLAVE